jgi:hypothetical protein
MKDGQIEGGLVWFGFDLHDLEWLQDLIPRGDEFRRAVTDAISRLKAHERRTEGEGEKG